MSTFAKINFNASGYSASRPTYPKQLFEYIFQFHRKGMPPNLPKWDMAVDLGCGTGQATSELTLFREVLGLDPSLTMLEKANACVPKRTNGTILSFQQGFAEDLRPVIPQDESVDLVISAQAAHWFDWVKVWPETQRILRPGGTAAFWIYAELRLSQYPDLTNIITNYLQGNDEKNSLGPYFQRPGRTVLERHLVDVPEPSTIIPECNLSQTTRVFFCGNDVPSFLPPVQDRITLPIIMKTRMTWRDLLAYIRTISALHNYHEKYPEDLHKPEDTRFLEEDLKNGESAAVDLRGGDIGIRFWKDLREGALQIHSDIPVGADDGVDVEWPLALLLTRKG